MIMNISCTRVPLDILFSQCTLDSLNESENILISSVKFYWLHAVENIDTATDGALEKNDKRLYYVRLTDDV